MTPTRSSSPIGVAAGEAALLLAAFALYGFSFGPSSPLHGPYEVFAQDSVYLLEALEEGETYRWNPQSHLLYHWGIELGHDLWRAVAGPEASTFVYLKLVTALCGIVFLALMLRLFRELGLAFPRRLALAALTAVSLSAWFHFAAFETHVFALPGVALYAIALVRLRRRAARAPTPNARASISNAAAGGAFASPEGAWSWFDHGLLVASLLLCGWTRFDLFRLAAVTSVLLVLPAFRPLRRGLALDLVAVAALGVAGNTALAAEYLSLPLKEAALVSFERKDRRDLREQLGQLDNLTPRHLLAVGRAVSLYGFVMPVQPALPGGWLAPPIQHVELVWSGKGPYPSSGLFLEPARNLLGSAISTLALLAGLAIAATTAAIAAHRSWRGDPLHVAIAAQIVAGWIFYTWFNPFEPFLWIAEFTPLGVALLADGTRREPRAATVGIAAAAGVLALHNGFAFYASFS